ncbi:MAG: signal peptidase I [Bacillota bacterium]
MSNNFWPQNNEDKAPWEQDPQEILKEETPLAQTSLMDNDPLANKTIIDEKPWPQESAEQQSTTDLLALAAEAEAQASNASEAAKTAMLAAQAADNAIKANFTSYDERIHKAKIEAAHQASLAAEAALNAQISARDTSIGAVSQAEASAEKLLILLKNFEKELQHLEELSQESIEMAENAAETAAIAVQKAEMEEQKKQAAQAAYLAAKILKEQAASDYQKAQEELSAAKNLAQTANLKLAAVQQQNLRIKEETLFILQDISPERPQTSTDIFTTPTEQSTTEQIDPLFDNIDITQNADQIQPEELQAEEVPLNDQVLFTSEPSIFGEEKIKKEGISRTAWGIVKLVLIALAIALVLRTFVFEMTVVNGSSMMPTLSNGDRLLTSKITYIISKPQRGDVIIVDAPDRNKEYYIKRIIGMPNEQITIKDGLIYINGDLYTEPYLTQVYTDGNIDMIIDDDSYFVMGDNRNESHDSRDSSVSTISSEHVLGKAVLRIYPFSEFGSLYDK